MKSDRVRRAIILFLCVLVVVVVAFGAQTGASMGHSSAAVPYGSLMTVTTLIDFNPNATAIAAPTITSISPDSGPIAGGNEVLITGTGFNEPGMDVQVWFGDSDVTSGCTWNLSGTKCTVNDVPAHAAGTVRVKVLGPGGGDAAEYTYVDFSTTTLLDFNPNATSFSTTTTLIDFNPNATSFSTTTLIDFNPNATSFATTAEAEDEGGGLAGGWIALIVVAAVVVLGALAYTLSKRSKRGGPTA